MLSLNKLNESFVAEMKFNAWMICKNIKYYYYYIYIYLFGC